LIFEIEGDEATPAIFHDLRRARRRGADGENDDRRNRPEQSAMNACHRPQQEVE
jgi:hypothetical protein